jgi:hypothetical protein
MDDGDDVNRLAADAFKLFHTYNLWTATEEEARIEETIVYRAIVRNLDKLCPHDLIGIGNLIDALLKRQAGEHGHKH